MNHSKRINDLYICPTYNHFDTCLPNANSSKKILSHTLSHTYTHTTTHSSSVSPSLARERAFCFSHSLLSSITFTHKRAISQGIAAGTIALIVSIVLLLVCICVIVVVCKFCRHKATDSNANANTNTDANTESI